MHEKLSQILDAASGISDDSRNISKNYIFFAISGNSTDGTKFIETALEKGAMCIVSEKSKADINCKLPLDVTYIRVEDARTTLAESLKIFHGDLSSKIKMIGITGTNGKTTISNLIYSLLSSQSKKVALIGTNGIYFGLEKQESKLTTPGIVELYSLLLSAIEHDCTHFVMEVSSHSLDQKRVHGINFDIAIFSNLSQDHLDYHKTMESYAQAKKILFDNLNNSATAITNLDDKFGSFMLENSRAIKIGLLSKNKSKNSSISSNNKFEGNISCFERDKSIISIDGKNFYNNLIGEYNAYNLSQAILAVLELGFSYNMIKESTKQLQSPEGRLQLIELKNSALAIVDYAHTPDALQKALLALKSECKGKLICVFGCGGDRDKTKRPLMAIAALNGSDTPIVTSDNPRTENPDAIISDIIVGNEDKFIIEPDRKKAILLACNLAKADDVILIAGKGHEKYQIIGSTKIDFDDVAILKQFNINFLAK